MDFKKQKKISFKLKRISLFLLAILLCLVCLYFYLQITEQRYQVDKNNIIISTVNFGSFSIEVRGNGVLVPKYIRWISSNVDGHIEQVRVKPGTVVETGDVIAVMVNPELTQKTEEIRWEMEAGEANLKALQMRHINNILDAQSKVFLAKQNYEKAKFKYDAEKKLYKKVEGFIPKIEFERSRLDSEGAREFLNVEKQRLATLKAAQESEFIASQAMLNKIKNSLSRSEDLLNSLTVVANQNGVIQEVNIEAGQQILTGSNIVKLALEGNLIAELDIPERQIRDVAIGKKVIVNTSNSIIDGEVTRIAPGVINGTVQVDVTLSGEIPPEVRPDLSIQGTIIVSNISNTLSVARPSLAQSNKEINVFKVSADGLSAIRVPVRFGAGSANEIEIKSGLKVGDRIITSNTDAWAHLEQINLK